MMKLRIAGFQISEKSDSCVCKILEREFWKLTSLWRTKSSTKSRPTNISWNKQWPQK